MRIICSRFIYYKSHSLGPINRLAGAFVQVIKLSCKLIKLTPKHSMKPWANIFFFECDSYPMPADSAVSDIERTPCWSERLRRKQGRACRTDTHRSLMCTSCWDGSSTLETRRGYPSRSAEGWVRMLLVSEELFAWLVLLSGGRHAGAWWLFLAGGHWWS